MSTLEYLLLIPFDDLLHTTGFTIGFVIRSEVFTGGTGVTGGDCIIIVVHINVRRRYIILVIHAPIESLTCCVSDIVHNAHASAHANARRARN